MRGIAAGLLVRRDARLRQAALTMRAAAPQVDDDAAQATVEPRVELGRPLDDSERLEAVERAIQQLSPGRMEI